MHDDQLRVDDPRVDGRDAVLRLASGASFASPAPWLVDRTTAGVRLDAPEGNLSLHVLDIGGAAGAASAVAEGWRLADPGTERVVRLETAGAAANGWDALVQVDYEPTPGARAVSQGFGFEREGRWTVALVAGALATLEKRGAELALALQSLRAPGHASWSAAGRAPVRLDATRIADLLEFTRRAMDSLGVPGVGLAICDRGGVLFEGGLGHRAAGSPEPVEAKTLFQVASNTKSMTTLLLARLVDAGKVSWDDRVVDVYPAFRLGSEEMTGRILIRHLVSASTGLPRKDLVWAFTNRLDTPPSRIFQLLAGSVPTSGFGEVFQYNNLMAAAAGFIAGHLVHPALDEASAFDAAMQEFVFDPLGMSDTTFDPDLAVRVPHATPHSQDWTGRTVAVDPRLGLSGVASRPSGGAWSSAADMIRFVLNEVREGELPDGSRMIGREALLERRWPGVRIGEHGAYGMGLMIEGEAGVTAIHHGGSAPGFMSDFVVFPEAGVGAVLLTNADAGMFLLGPFRRKLLELLYDAPAEAEGQVAAAAHRGRLEQDRFAAATSVPPEPEAAGLLAPKYTSDELGDLDVRRDEDALAFDFDLFSTLMGSQRDTSGEPLLVSVEPGVRGLVFEIKKDGPKGGMVVREGQHDYLYVPR